MQCVFLPLSLSFFFVLNKKAGDVEATWRDTTASSCSVSDDSRCRYTSSSSGPGSLLSPLEVKSRALAWTRERRKTENRSALGFVHLFLFFLPGRSSKAELLKSSATFMKSASVIEWNREGLGLFCLRKWHHFLLRVTRSGPWRE